MKLLLVEDEQRMAKALVNILKLEQYDVEHMDNGRSAIDAIVKGTYAVIVLDVMLPELSGFEVAKSVRQAGVTTPILMLTAKGELEDKVEGLDCGADDYLTKPFMTKELLARLRALTRRNFSPNENKLTFGDIELEKENMTLHCTANEKSVRLSEKEYKILACMMQHQKQITSREQLALKIWGYENDAEYNNVEVYMTFTRKKLAFIESNVEIKAVRGVGYELRKKYV